MVLLGGKKIGTSTPIKNPNFFQNIFLWWTLKKKLKVFLWFWLF